MVECAPHFIAKAEQRCYLPVFPDWMSHVPTGDAQNIVDPAVAPDRTQGAKSPAVAQDSPPDSEDCIDLPTYVSLIAEQSRSSADFKTSQTASVALSEVPNLKEPAENLERRAEQYCHRRRDSNRTEAKEDDVLLVVAPKEIGTSENHVEESASVAPLDRSTNEENQDVPLLNRPASCIHPLASPLFCDPQRENGRRGCLPGSKVMKRSSSVISDSGIESEPSSVAWPLDAAPRDGPPGDFSSELEIPQRAACRRPVHRSSLEGLQMESSGSLPSAGIQASLTSISSLPYEEDQQQRRLSKLTKSVSAPQISSPEETEDDHALRDRDADAKSPARRRDPCSGSCSLPNHDFDTPPFVDSGLAPPSALSGAEMSGPSQDRSEAFTSTSALSDASESPRVKEGAVNGSRGENPSHQTRPGEASTTVERVHFVGTEASARSRGNQPSVRGKEAGDECQSFHATEPPHERSCPDASRPPLELSASERPSDLTGLLLDHADLNGISARLDFQAKPAKIPNSGLAFVNKKMAEMVNMSVSCAPTCLPFSSVLRDSPSVSGMSPRQATSPITHQPLGSFGVISSSSLSHLNMEDATNERMLK